MGEMGGREGIKKKLAFSFQWCSSTDLQKRALLVQEGQCSSARQCYHHSRPFRCTASQGGDRCRSYTDVLCHSLKVQVGCHVNPFSPAVCSTMGRQAFVTQQT